MEDIYSYVHCGILDNFGVIQMLLAILGMTYGIIVIILILFLNKGEL